MPMLLLASCAVGTRVVPSNDFVTKDIAAADIRHISVSSSIEVNYKQSDRTTVSVSCPDNLIDYLRVNVDDGVLAAGFKNGLTIDGNCGVVITVSSPGLESIDASSSSRVNVADVLTVSGALDVDASSSAGISLAAVLGGNVSVDVSSSANVNIGSLQCRSLAIDCSSSSQTVITKMLCDNVEADASSASSLSLSGRAGSAVYDASSAATIDASGLVAECVKHAKASSASNIYCSAVKTGQLVEESSGHVNCK